MSEKYYFPEKTMGKIFKCDEDYVLEFTLLQLSVKLGT
jgi:hypothetical protein